MRPDDSKSDLIDSYMSLLNSLSPKNKLGLISKLSDSFKGCKKATGESINGLYGAFISKESAEEILSNLKANRNFKRN